MEEDLDLANEMDGFDGELLKRVTKGSKTLFSRKQSTTIYQVPKTIFTAKQELFNPRLLWLGLNWVPDKIYPSAKVEQLHITAHMHSILTRNPNNTFVDYLRAMNAMREEIRACYSVQLTMDFRNLISLVLSCGHILDSIILFFEGKLTPQEDQFCSSGLHTLWVDFLLVKNQVPFFALQRIYDMLNLDQSKYPSLVELCLRFFEKFLVINRRSPPMESGSIHHLLHLVHYHLLPSNDPPKHQVLMQLIFTKMKSFILSSPTPELPTSASLPHGQQLTFESILSARSLQEVGIKFRKKKTAGFSSITFHRGVLEIPFLRIDNNTEILLRNFTAWEQCHLSAGSYFTSYSIFMDYIINAAEDVQILSQVGIIEQTLGSEEEVASIFNGLSTNIAYNGDEKDFLPKLNNDLNRYCRNTFLRWKAKVMADLMSHYFRSPWAIISTVAAIFLLLLTSTQSFFSAYAYFRPP